MKVDRFLKKVETAMYGEVFVIHHPKIGTGD